MSCISKPKWKPSLLRNSETLSGPFIPGIIKPIPCSIDLSIASAKLLYHQQSQDHEKNNTNANDGGIDIK